MSVCLLFFLERYGDHRDLHVLTHSFPTRRSSDLAEGAAQRGVGEPKCAAFWGDRASLTGVSSWLVRWEDRDEAPVSGGAPMPLLRLIDRCPARCATARTSRPVQTHLGFPVEQPRWSAA